MNNIDNTPGKTAPRFDFARSLIFSIVSVNHKTKHINNDIFGFRYSLNTLFGDYHNDCAQMLRIFYSIYFRRNSPQFCVIFSISFFMSLLFIKIIAVHSEQYKKTSSCFKKFSQATYALP